MDNVETLNYGGVSAMPPVPTPISLHSFCEDTLRNRILPSIRETYSPQNIALYGISQMFDIHMYTA